MSTKDTHIPPHLRVPFAGVTPAPKPGEGQKLFPTGNWRFFRPIYRDKTPPCNHACPTEEKIQKYLDLVKHGRFEEAYGTIKEDNPMPSITGRVCYHPCETACNRGQHDEPIAIRSVERVLGDFGLALAQDVVKPGKPTGKRVAVVGSGPGGLAAAYHLARAGHGVTVFEALPKPGGMLRGGIPEWHLPQEVLDAEIRRITDLGVEIVCNTRFGVNKTWDDLKGYDAAFLSVGQDVGRKMRVPGEELRNIVGGVEFLKAVGDGNDFGLNGKRVAIIGGGNTALDCARSAVRLGALGATMIALEGRHELPATEEEVLQGIDEGCKLRNNAAVTRFLGEGTVSGMLVAEGGLAKDEHGAIRPVVREGTEVEVPVDFVVVAIGQTQRLEWVPQKLLNRGLIMTDEFGRVEGNIFAGGDMVRGPGMVVQALGDGKKAAQNIARVLRGEELAPPPLPDVILYDRLNPNYFKHAPRVEVPLTAAATRASSQKIEVTLAYTVDQAQNEADRCMSCGVCNGCDNCYIVCPDVCISRDHRQNSTYEVNLDFCKGCLVCVQECPTGCLERVPEMEFVGDVIRMETAFQVTKEAHSKQADELEEIMRQAIAEADAARAGD